MEKKVYASLLILLAITVALYRGAVDRAVPVVEAEVRDQDNRAAAGTKWEYCAVSRAAYTATNRRGAYWITYFKETGTEVVGVEEGALDQDAAVAKVIARLGEDGWEMVGESDLPVKAGRVNALYFKRAKQ